MPNATLKKVLDEIKRLRREELREVERAIQELLEPRASESEREAALRVLETSGLVRVVRRPPIVAGPRRPPVPIQGKPLSETIIEERR